MERDARCRSRVPRKHVDRKGQRRQRIAGVVLVENTSGAARDQFDVLAFGQAVLDKDAEAFTKTFAFAGVTPAPETNAAHRSRVAILLQPLAANAIGRALIHGRIVMPIDVIDTAHTRATSACQL